MAIDIKNGDILVIGTNEYRISAVEEYDAHPFGYSKAFTLRADTACSTERDTVANLTGLYCTALDPVAPDTRITPISQTPMTVKQTFINSGADYVRIEVSIPVRR